MSVSRLAVLSKGLGPADGCIERPSRGVMSCVGPGRCEMSDELMVYCYHVHCYNTHVVLLYICIVMIIHVEV